MKLFWRLKLIYIRQRSALQVQANNLGPPWLFILLNTQSSQTNATVLFFWSRLPLLSPLFTLTDVKLFLLESTQETRCSVVYMLFSLPRPPVHAGRVKGAPSIIDQAISKCPY